MRWSPVRSEQNGRLVLNPSGNAISMYGTEGGGAHYGGVYGGVLSGGVGTQTVSYCAPRALSFSAAALPVSGAYPRGSY